LVTGKRESRNDAEILDVSPSGVSAEKLSEKLMLEEQYETN
jgi:hypothetical protein